MLKVTKLLFVNLALLSMPACSDDSTGLPVSVYQIPKTYQPEPVRRRLESGIREIASREMSFVVPVAVLTGRIDRFNAEINGQPQDIYVIVKSIPDTVREEWETPAATEKIRREIWNREGIYESACFDQERDSDIGLFVYYATCDPEPNLNSTVFLMDQIPSGANPQPGDGTYIKGVCTRLPDPSGTQEKGLLNCLMGRTTEYGDRYSFRLTGENIPNMEQVESLIDGLLLEWFVERR